MIQVIEAIIMTEATIFVLQERIPTFQTYNLSENYFLQSFSFMAINYHIRQAIVSKRDETIDVTYQYSIQAFYCIVVQYHGMLPYTYLSSQVLVHALMSIVHSSFHEILKSLIQLGKWVKRDFSHFLWKDHKNQGSKV